jgi:cytochrome d ubiquinol oxidase subunit I
MQDLLMTLAGFVTFYTVLFIVEMGLMLKYIRKGPYRMSRKPTPGLSGTTAPGRTHAENAICAMPAE